ncbi:sel1 repeat family protein [Pelistega sp. NLN82]|uniref:Sel1 repeat family protein n=1 Tax=Pelistega ratti TaxID=2652177 RepID=A0A6L9Y8I6_9BURK|nr:tetratricopeptide repeat protein [Pelistega ratti]NEN76197.1 sel1 repeat family protein [Pelistega ratti]
MKHSLPLRLLARFAQVCLLSCATSYAVASSTNYLQDQLHKAQQAFDIKDYEKAMAILRPLAEQGNAEAQFKLGSMYQFAQGVQTNYNEAIYWYLKSAKKNFASAQYNIGNMYFYGEGVSQSYSTAAIWFLKAAKQGHTGAQTEIGKMYQYGLGVRKDKQQSLYWLRKAHKNTDSIVLYQPLHK